jgi:hypothetical protein
MAKSLTYDMENFRTGLVLLNDDSTAPVGSARVMNNISITDRGGIAPRPGTRLLGPVSSGGRGRGFFVFKKSYGDKQIPMRAYEGVLEAYYAVNDEWFTVKSGYTEDKKFDFTHNFVVTENEDYTYFCNRFQPFSRWNGQIAQIQGELLGAETTINVDTVLRPDIFSSVVSTASSTTTLTQTSETWANSQWVNMWVLIVDGAQAGAVRKITANTSGQITFGALPGDPGIGTKFEIRETIFDLTKNNKFIYNGTEITVTAIPTETTLTVASAHAAPDGTPITNVPQEYPAAPRGNRITTLKGRTFVGRVRSGLTRDSGGALQGSNVGSSLFGTKLLDPTDFAYAAPRVAGEGIVAAVPYGGDEITDIAPFENVIYVYKPSYIESFQMSDDDDAVKREPLKAEAGSVGRIIKGRDDHYFITLDKQFTSLGRVEGKDSTPSTLNIGLVIKRLLDTYDFSDVAGFEYRNRILFSARGSDDEEENNITLVWNKTTASFEGVWNIGAHGFDTYENELYFLSSINPNVYKMFEPAKKDVEGSNEFPIAAQWRSNFFNLLPIKGKYQAIESVALEGYIAANTQYTFTLFKDWETEATVEFSFGSSGDDENFLVGTDLASFLGSNPLGLQPIGVLDQPDADGRRRFQFIVYFPYVYGQYFSVGFDSHGINQDWEVVRASLGLRESVSTVRKNIKSN